MKTLQDIETVIELGKPEAVIDVYVQEYLQGLAQEAFDLALEEYNRLLLPVEVVEPEEGQEPLPGVDHSARLAELEALYPQLVTKEELPLVLDLARGKELKRGWIKKAMENRIRERYSLDDEAFLSRIGVGQALGVYQMSEGEMAELLAYSEYVEGVREWGRGKRAELSQ